MQTTGMPSAAPAAIAGGATSARAGRGRCRLRLARDEARRNAASARVQPLVLEVVADERNRRRGRAESRGRGSRRTLARARAGGARRAAARS